MATSFKPYWERWEENPQMQVGTDWCIRHIREDKPCNPTETCDCKTSGWMTDFKRRNYGYTLTGQYDEDGDYPIEAA